MNELRLRFNDGDQPDLVLGHGVHALGRLPTGLGPVAPDAPWLLQVCNDRRGIWLTVADAVRGVHVNGRPVQNVALLRAGDSIHLDGNELLLAAGSDDREPVAPPGAPRDPVANLRYALRGIGGAHHGRAISLEQARRIGQSRDADIRIDGPAIADDHASIEIVGQQVLLRATGGDVQVNGHRVRELVLRAGDQVAFDVRHRFVLEGPPPQVATRSPRPDYPADVDAPPLPPRAGWLGRTPWLLVAAALLGGLLSALLLFGAR